MKTSREVLRSADARATAQTAARRFAALIGQQVEILVEGPNKRNPDRLRGRTGCNRIVVFEGSARHLGQVMKLRITRAGSFTLYGDPAILE